MSVKKNFGTWEEAVRWLRTQPDMNDLVTGAYYDDPLLDAAKRYWNSQEWAKIQKFLPCAKESTALDVGAGRGIASYAMARDGFAVTALEPDSSNIVGSGAIRSLAEQAGLIIEVREDFSEKLPFEDGRFDVVFARAVLHHTRDLGEACKEFFRVLKPGGRLIAIREHVISRPEDLESFFEIHPLHKLYGGENAFLLSQYLEAIKGAGFIMHRVLGPMESSINLAPHTDASFCAELAFRVARGMPGVAPLVRGLLSLPCVWPLARNVLKRFDHRPGRLYSFVAGRP